MLWWNSWHEVFLKCGTEFKGRISAPVEKWTRTILHHHEGEPGSPRWAVHLLLELLCPPWQCRPRLAPHGRTPARHQPCKSHSLTPCWSLQQGNWPPSPGTVLQSGAVGPAWPRLQCCHAGNGAMLSRVAFCCPLHVLQSETSLCDREWGRGQFSGVCLGRPVLCSSPAGCPGLALCSR